MIVVCARTTTDATTRTASRATSRRARWTSEKDAKLAQKLGQLQPFIVVLHRNTWADLHFLGQPNTFLDRRAPRAARARLAGHRLSLLTGGPVILRGAARRYATRVH